MSDIVTITGIAVGGDGVGRLAAGRVVFVPRTAPGDRIRLRDGSLQRHRNFARALLGEVVEAGPGRVAPPCPHYVHDHCGGCQLQHLAYDGQLSAKRAIVGDTLRRIGKLKVDDLEVVEALEEWRYRSKISMDVKTSVGLHPYDRPNFVFPLADCHITDFRLMALWRELRGRVAMLPQPLTRLTLRLDREERRHIIAESAGAPWLNADELRAALQRDPLTSLANRRAIRTRLDDALAQARRQQQSLGVMLLDIDDLKMLNDTWGEAEGDVVLQRVATRLTESIGPDDSVGRFAAGRFMIVVPACNMYETVMLAERIRKSLCDTPIDAGCGPIPISASFGVSADLPEPDQAAKPLIEAAQRALHRAKAAGGNRVCLAASDSQAVVLGERQSAVAETGQPRTAT